MLYFFTGTDREKVRSAMNVEIERVAKKTNAHVLRITDAHAVGDLRTALQGSGMFDASRVVVFEGVLAHEEMAPILMDALQSLKQSPETVFVYEEKPVAAERKKIEKYAEESFRYDRAGKERDTSIFVLSSALAHGDRKVLWVEYQRALARGEAPEAIHGVLFWGAKRMLLAAPKGNAAHRKGETYAADFAELPHKARRGGVELEYALERYLLTVNKV